MGLKRIGPGRYAYDVHVWGATERPRGVLENTTVHKARAFYVSETARIKQSGSLTFSTVGEVLAVYLREHYQHTARYAVSPAPYEAVQAGIGHYSLSHFKAADFLAWLGRKGAENIGTEQNPHSRRPDTVNGYIMIAKSAFNWARKYHNYPLNPLAQVKPLDPENRQMWVYGPEHIRAILDAARGGAYYHVFLALKYWPMRRGELLRLRGCDIFRRFIRLPDETNKTKKGRTLPIPEDRELVAFLRGVPRECPHVFCTAGKDGLRRVPIGGKNLLRWLKAHKDALKLPGATVHGFRRTVAVRLDEARVSLPVIAELTGHADLRTLHKRYLPVSMAQKDEAMETLVSTLRHGQNLDKRGGKAAAA